MQLEEAKKALAGTAMVREVKGQELNVESEAREQCNTIAQLTRCLASIGFEGSHIH